MNTRLYLNHAGTSWPKPPEVVQAISSWAATPPEQWPTTLARAHQEVCSFFGFQESERFLLTSGCTAALSLAMSDFPWEPGDLLFISAWEHHALSRWAIKLVKERGITYKIIPPDGDAPVDLAWLAREFKAAPVRMLALSHASNVTGALLPIERCISLAHEHGATCLLDAAQSAGIKPLDVSALGADIFVFSGHKGPLGPHGIGGLYLAPGVSLNSPLAACSIERGQASCASFPSYCDAGSVNMTGVVGMAAGLRWLQENDMQALFERAEARTQRLLDGLQALPGVMILGPKQAAARTYTVSCQVADWAPATLAEELKASFGIVVSAGHQCAPMAHETLGTSEHGTLRISSGVATTEDDIHTLLSALKTILIG